MGDLLIKISGFIERSGLTYYSVSLSSDRPGIAADLLKLFALERINLEYITESTNNGNGAVLAFCVDAADAKNIDRLTNKQESNIKKMENASFIGVYGPHFREKPAIAAKFCTTLGINNINIYGISSSISSIACIIKAGDLEMAKKALLDVFELP